MAAHGGLVGRAAINSGGVEVAVKNSALDIARGPVGLGVAYRPRAWQCPLQATTIGSGDVWRHHIVVIERVEMPGQSHLSKIAHALDRLSLRLCLAQGG